MKKQVNIDIKIEWDQSGDIKPNFWRHKILKTINGLPANVRKANPQDFINSKGEIISGKPFLFQYFFQEEAPNTYYAAKMDPLAFLERDDSIHHALMQGLVWVLKERSKK